MTEALIVAGLWGLFGGSHVGLGLLPVRRWIGGRRFSIAFSLVAAVAFAILVVGTTALRGVGLRGPPSGGSRGRGWR